MDIEKVPIPYDYDLKRYGNQKSLIEILMLHFKGYKVIGFEIKHNPDTKKAILVRIC